jgi:soluble lytic murein transglycosylase
MRITTTTLVVLLLIFNLFADKKSLAAESVAARDTYLKAEKLLWQSESPRFKALYNQLHYYSLQPYLDQQILINHMSLSRVADIDAFLKKYQGSPLDWPLRMKWLTYLAKKDKATLFLEYYKPTSNVALTCLYYRYQLLSGIHRKKVLPKVTELWTVGKSQNNACDPLFKEWEQAGYQTDVIVWRRIKLAADGGQHTLIPYLTKKLPKRERYLGGLWGKVRSDPSYINKLSRFPNKSSKETEIIVYGLKRLIWRDQNLAINTYKKSLKTFNFSEDQKSYITSEFAVALASKNHKKSKYWLAQVDVNSLTKKIVEFRLTGLIKRQEWSMLIVEFLNLPDRYKNALQWRYWYARALIETQEKRRGESLLKLLANERHYYGFLAASTLNLPANLQHKPIEITEREKITVLKSFSAKRAFELFYLNRTDQARREWDFWLQTLNKRQKLVASILAFDAKWFDRAIFTLPQEGYLDEVDLRFPEAYKEKINQHSKQHKINPTWTFAITRRESSFMSDANSAVGAKGLMQLMPRTAQELGYEKSSEIGLLDSANNIKLGTKYLRNLLDMSEGNQVVATASYNAGPYRVKSWLKNSESLPADIWIETIPFKETREYVKSVLAYQQIYQIKAGQLDSVFDQVIKMNIPDK